MWRKLRIALLLLVLGIAAYSNWYDRYSTTGWDKTLWIGIFPVNADDGQAGNDYIAALSAEDLADIERFINDQAHDFGVALARPVRVDLYPEVHEKPPPHDATGNVFSDLG